MKRVMAIMAALAMAGCSGQPGNADLREALTGAEGSLLELTAVEKVNGYEQADNQYVVKAEAEFEFIDSYDNLLANATGFEKMEMQMVGAFYGKFDKGDSYSNSYTVTFVDSENGWKPINVK